MATKFELSKDQLRDFATAGVAQRIAAIEHELATYHRQWPQLFITTTPPQLLKVHTKSGSQNGHGPATPDAKPTKTKDTSGIKASWTPERRAAHAEHMKARWKKPGYKSKFKKSRQKSKKSKSTRTPAGRLAKVQAYLKEHGESAIKDMMKATGYQSAAGIISAMELGLKSGRFQRTGKGRYALGPKA